MRSACTVHEHDKLLTPREQIETGCACRQAKAAADRASDSIDDVLAFVEASDKRIAQWKLKASKI